MNVGLLGLQGAFLDHIRHLKTLNADYTIVRDSKGLEKIDRLIIPGGESTVMMKFLTLFHMTGLLQKRIDQGMPVWGICAGSILLAKKQDNKNGILNALEIKVQRNAYGRQAASEQKNIDIPILQRFDFPALFIRAPRIVSCENRVEVMARSDNDPVFIRQEYIMATTFHPELTDDPVFHEYFLNL
ncbi:Pyridoxal 5'-phosphate synthase, subunit PdxT [Desulfonema limicola]|uniref:glutaminase n=1 Tax=Desulfonema limicola TaxID=45656 RepID=A0A975GI47_9BACT|nr:pyridoxal 5'-phosphate synthase glutaminase subunit PdxT [Desulfonema limicola]QTA81493.1 Pyridoxal 5'-phosphate synthase, subunit PdxT [Desulfonema limicola]